MGIDDIKSVVWSACRKKNWIVGEGVFSCVCLEQFPEGFDSVKVLENVKDLRLVVEVVWHEEPPCVG